MAVISAPADWVESVSELRLPATASRRLQELMDRNTEGQLALTERKELESLVEVSEALSLVRAEAFWLLSREPDLRCNHRGLPPAVRTGPPADSSLE